MKTLATAALIFTLAAPLVASGEDELTSLSYIAYLERYATIRPATAGDDIEAVTNMPLVVGDRVDTAREARMEIVLADGGIVWLDQYTTVSLDAVAFSRDVGGERTVLYLVDGSIIVQIPPYTLTAEPTRVDSSLATVYLREQGVYRIEVLRSGGLRLEVWEGQAEAATTAGGVLVQPATAAEVRDGQVLGVEPHLTWGDDFARWVEQRRQVYDSESGQFVDERYAREAAILDGYGDWVWIDASESWAWQPAVSADWRPFTAGRWHWTSTGWSWLSYEPWGWLPYHYGSWFIAPGFGWVWGWGSVWSPAWVSWCWWPGFVSWCPWGFYNSWCWGAFPGWGWGWGWGSSPPPPGPGQPRPPRGNVIPPRDGVGPGDSGRRQTPDPMVRAGADATGGSRRLTPSDGAGRATAEGRAAADFTGHVRVAEMDRAGWNVVAADDFASEHLSRVVQPGDRVMADHAGATGVVVTGPLTTRSPAAARTADELARSFTEVGARTDRDITRVMARDASLRREDIDRLVQPTSLAELGRSSAQTTVAASRTADRSAGASPGSTGAPALTIDSRSPLAPSASSRSALDRVSMSNIYRPGRTVSSGGVDTGRSPVVPGPGAVGGGGRSPSSVGSAPSSGRSLPPATSSPSVRGTGSIPGSRSVTTLPRARTPSSLPSARSSSSPLVRQPVSPGLGGGRPGSSVSSSRPVIVPRTSPSRPSRSMGSGFPGTAFPSVRGAPSGRSSSPSSSARAPAPSSSGRSSAGSSPSRSSGGSGSSRSSASSGGSAARSRPH